MNEGNSKHISLRWPALLAAGAVLLGCVAIAAPMMTVEGPFMATGDYIQARPGLEATWTYYLTNTSTVGAENNMIAWQINAGFNNNILKVEYEKYTSPSELPIIYSSYLTNTSIGFTGLVPPVPDENNFDPSTIVIRLYTPASTPAAPGLAVATAQGVGYAVPFPSVAVDVPAALPTVDFTGPGFATQIGTTTQYTLPVNVFNHMNTEPAGNPYNDYVSEIRIEGIYSAEKPSFVAMPSGWSVLDEEGYEAITLTDPARRLWRMVAGTTLNSSRFAPGQLSNININFTLPSGIPDSAIRYGNVNAQGGTSGHSYQPNPTPDTFIGPVGVEYPAPVVGLTLAAEQVRLGLAGLVVGREYRVMRSEDLSGWEEADRFTVVEGPMPASGRVDREWSEAAVLPGRRFYKLEWDEP